MNSHLTRRDHSGRAGRPWSSWTIHLRSEALLFVAGAMCLVTSACKLSDTPTCIRVTEEDWSYRGAAGVRLITDHFDIRTTVRDDELRAALPAFIEACHAQYASLVRVPETESTSRLDVFLFQSRHEWEQFTRTRFPQRQAMYRRIRSGGYTAGDVCVCYALRDRGQTLGVIAHEGMHQYLSRHIAAPLPAWLNEGLASYCEAVDLAGNTPRFTPQHNLFRMNSLREALAEGRLIPLGELLNTDAGTILTRGESRRTRTYYAQSWALIAYLRHGAGGSYADEFDDLLADLVDGSFQINAQAARLTADSPATATTGESLFRFYFGDDVSAFEAGYVAYLYEVASM